MRKLFVSLPIVLPFCILLFIGLLLLWGFNGKADTLAVYVYFILLYAVMYRLKA